MSEHREKIRGRTALVTGAGAVIGRAIAQRLAGAGASVVVVDADREQGQETAAKIEAGGGQAAFCAADVGVEVDVRAMIAFTEERFGGLDILVNSLEMVPEPRFPRAAATHWRRTLHVNLRGVSLGVQFGLAAMRRRGGGLVVNIASMVGRPFQALDTPEYVAAKAGLIQLTAALGFLSERENVRVNCICLGWVLTDAVQRGEAEMTAEEKAGLDYPPPAVPIRPEGVAELVMMFVDDETLAGRVILWPDGEPWRPMPPKKS